MAVYLVTFAAGAKVPTRTKYVTDASVAPDANDDAATLGTTVGSLWIDQTAGKVYVCRDASTGAAVWTDLTASGGGTDDQTAAEVPFDSDGLDHTDADDVQEALEDLDAAISSAGAGWRDPTTLHTNLSASGAIDLDRDVAATHYLELAGSATLTPTDSDPPGAGHDIDVRAHVLGDGTSALAFGGSITWATGSPPAAPGAGELLTLAFTSTDDATTWRGYASTSGGADLGDTVASETTFGIAASAGTAETASRSDHTHGTPTGIGPILVASEPAGSPLVFADLLQNSEGTDLLYASEP